MSEKKFDGGAAFPEIETDREHGECEGDGDIGRTYSYGGMSLRDWFAGMALVGALSNEAIEERGFSGEAKAAYMMAEAMLKERNHE